MYFSYKTVYFLRMPNITGDSIRAAWRGCGFPA